MSVRPSACLYLSACLPVFMFFFVPTKLLIRVLRCRGYYFVGPASNKKTQNHDHVCVRSGVCVLLHECSTTYVLAGVAKKKQKKNQLACVYISYVKTPATRRTKKKHNRTKISKYKSSHIRQQSQSQASKIEKFEKLKN